VSELVVEVFGPEHLEGFAKLFEGASSTCFCRYWSFGGTKNEWLDRCAHRPEENLAEHAAALRSPDDAVRASASGLVALENGGVVGWMKVAPRETIPKLTRLPVYRNLPSEPGTWTIACFLVAEAHRHRGVAKALVARAEELVPTWGGTAIEAHPRHSTEPLYDEEAWQGPERLFIERGYTAIHAMAPYPVYRKVLPHRHDDVSADG
jgi:GNAT superfamily N-acetyltransferase